jgi:flagellar biosynthesis protein FlhF
MSDLANFLELAKPDEVHLVLSTTTNQKAMERIIDSFSYCHIDRILLTKLDEAVNLGMVLNVLGRVQTELSYFTTGQNVPDDIEEGEARTLARMILS